MTQNPAAMVARPTAISRRLLIHQRLGSRTATPFSYSVRVAAEAGGDPRAAVAQTQPLMQRYDRLQADDPAVVRALGFDFGLVSMLDGLAVRLDQQEAPAGRPRRIGVRHTGVVPKNTSGSGGNG